ncbi:hypothetical protein A2335_04965 [Candidatus Peregrinibacteria bacterium RIFOXYB2_FULL_32_7]|nr:MAG: hypothetical protein A2335_04965 [Candidatus Peregrinibacteria bacterium RIFOXYB2_FULL_32_7]
MFLKKNKFIFFKNEAFNVQKLLHDLAESVGSGEKRREETESKESRALFEQQKMASANQVRNLDLLPETSKSKLVPLIRSVKDRQELSELEVLIHKAIKYARFAKESGAFEEHPEQIDVMIDWIVDPENLSQIDKNTNFLMRTIIPEEKNRVFRMALWKDFDPEIIKNYELRANSKEAQTTDLRKILFTEVEKNLKDKYKGVLEDSLDMGTETGKVKYQKLMIKFESMFGSNILDFDKRHEALVEAKDFLISMKNDKDDGYKAWYQMQKKKWTNVDDGRLIVLFENMQTDQMWKTEDNQKLFEMAKSKYGEELKSRSLQILDKATDNEEEKKSWLINFESADLETKVLLYQSLKTDQKQFSNKDKETFKLIDKYQKGNPAIFNEFNKRYAKERGTKSHEQILSEVTAEYDDIVKQYKNLIGGLDYDDKKKKLMMDDFLVLKDFTKMQERIKFFFSEIEKADKKEVKKDKEDEKLPENLEQVIENEIHEYFKTSSDQGMRSLILRSMVSQISDSQTYHKERALETRIHQSLKGSTNPKCLSNLKEQTDQLKDPEDEKSLIKNFVNNPREVRRLKLKDIQDSNFCTERQDILNMAEVAFGGIYDPDEIKQGNPRFDIVDEDRRSLDLREQGSKDSAMKKVVEKDRTFITKKVFEKLGLPFTNNQLFEKVAKMVEKMCDEFFKQNHREIFRGMCGEELRYV